MIVATKLLESLEDGTDKDTVATLVTKEYTKVLGETSLEEAVEQLEVIKEETKEETVEEVPTVVVEEETITTVPEKVEEKLEITDADQMVLKIVDSLSNLVDTKLADLQSKVESLMIQDQAQHQNKIYEDHIDALKQDLVLAATTEAQLTNELKVSLLGQIALLKQVDTGSEYYKKLETRSVKELQLTLEDHVALQTGSGSVTFAPVDETGVESTPAETATLAVTDSQKQVSEQVVEEPEQVDVTEAVASMSSEEDKVTLQITDADTVVSKIVADLGTRSLGKAEYASLYKTTASEHGISTAKKLHAVLKQQFKI